MNNDWSKSDSQTSLPTNNTDWSKSNEQVAPPDVQKAKDLIGNQDYNGWCETFVKDVTGHGWQGATAFDAWKNQQSNAVQGLNGIKPGDVIYFEPTLQTPAGHTGIYAGNNQFISATYQGVQNNDLMDWYKTTGQVPLGYVKTGKESN